MWSCGLITKARTPSLSRATCSHIHGYLFLVSVLRVDLGSIQLHGFNGFSGIHTTFHASLEMTHVLDPSLLDYSHHTSSQLTPEPNWA